VKRWLIAMLLAGGAGGAVVGTDWSGTLGTYLPCRRNWGWFPSYSVRSSPTESVTFRLGSVRVKVCYGSPRARGRKMIGGAAVPFGRLWRTGANEPTTIRTSAPITVAGHRVVGRASLYTVPGPETWEVVLNRSTSQWGIESAYTDQIRAQEIGRTVLPAGRDQEYQQAFTVVVDSTPGRSRLVLRWESVAVPIPIEGEPQ
jgi:hypothetical protein